MIQAWMIYIFGLQLGNFISMIGVLVLAIIFLFWAIGRIVK